MELKDLVWERQCSNGWNAYLGTIGNKNFLLSVSLHKTGAGVFIERGPENGPRYVADEYGPYRNYDDMLVGIQAALDTWNKWCKKLSESELDLLESDLIKFLADFEDKSC